VSVKNYLYIKYLFKPTLADRTYVSHGWYKINTLWQMDSSILITDLTLSRLFIIDADTAFGSLHHVDVGRATDVSAHILPPSSRLK
jgi:hypothetical protein